MDYAVLYVKHKELGCEAIKAINHVRINKRMILPCELVGFNGDKVTKEAREVNTASSTLWNAMFNAAPNPHKRLVEIWSEFVEWLNAQKISIIVDFGNNIKPKHEVSDYLKYMKSNADNELHMREAKEARYGRFTCTRINEIRVVH